MALLQQPIAAAAVVAVAVAPVTALLVAVAVALMAALARLLHSGSLQLHKDERGITKAAFSSKLCKRD